MRTPGFPGAVLDRGKGALDGIGCADVLPVFGREITERQQHILVLDQLLHGTFVFDAICIAKKIKYCARFHSCAGPFTRRAIRRSASKSSRGR